MFFGHFTIENVVSLIVGPIAVLLEIGLLKWRAC